MSRYKAIRRTADYGPEEVVPSRVYMGPPEESAPRSRVAGLQSIINFGCTMVRADLAWSLAINSISWSEPRLTRLESVRAASIKAPPLGISWGIPWPKVRAPVTGLHLVWYTPLVPREAVSQLVVMAGTYTQGHK